MGREAPGALPGPATGHEERPVGLGRTDERFVRRWLPAVRAVARLFRPRILGLEMLPADRPYILVGNHSGIFGLAELTCFAVLWLNRFGAERALAAVAHHLGFRVPGLSALHRRLGTVPSTRDAAQAALAAGVPLLVFPGGDHEAFRPIWQAGRVDFGGRHGFARLAFDAGIPLYPLAVCGSAWTAPVLWRSTWLLPRLLVVPHLLGLKRWPLSLLGGLGAVAAWLAVPGPWGAAVGMSFALSPLSMVPWLPARITFRVGRPVRPSGDAAETARRVEASLQRLVELGHGGDGED